MKILFTGGGTGGHLFPIIAIGREIRRLSNIESFSRADDFYDPNPKIKLSYMGPNDKMGEVLLTKEKFKIHTIISGKIRRYFSLQNITDILFKIPLGFLQSFFILLFQRPMLVFSKGGSGSYVVVLAAKVLGIPIFLHESDTVPGLSNRLAYKWAKKVFISFPKTAYFDLGASSSQASTKTILVGHPIEKELLEGNNESAKEIFNLTFEKPVLLFLGGSQGAQPINDFILSILNDLLKKYEVIHVCGKKNYKETLEQSKEILNKDLRVARVSGEAGTPDIGKYYHLYEFLDETQLSHAYKAANFVISRAGSGAIFEIAACGKPSILIPLPSSAGDHQSSVEQVLRI